MIRRLNYHYSVNLRLYKNPNFGYTWLMNGQKSNPIRSLLLLLLGFALIGIVILSVVFWGPENTSSMFAKDVYEADMVQYRSVIADAIANDDLEACINLPKVVNYKYKRTNFDCVPGYHKGDCTKRWFNQLETLRADCLNDLPTTHNGEVCELLYDIPPSSGNVNIDLTTCYRSAGAQTSNTDFCENIDSVSDKLYCRANISDNIDDCYENGQPVPDATGECLLSFANYNTAIQSTWSFEDRAAVCLKINGPALGVNWENYQNYCLYLMAQEVHANSTDYLWVCNLMIDHDPNLNSWKNLCERGFGIQ